MRQGDVFLLYFTAEKAATFLTEVYEPTFTAPGP